MRDDKFFKILLITTVIVFVLFLYPQAGSIAGGFTDAPLTTLLYLAVSPGLLSLLIGCAVAGLWATLARR